MRKISLHIILIISVLMIAGASFATVGFDPSTTAFGARPLSLGGAFVAQADDTNSLFLNPAGLTSLDNWTFTSMYTKLLETVDYRLLGGTYKLDNGTIGVGYIGTSNPAGFLTGTATNDVQGEISFDTHTLLVSYGNELEKIMKIEALPKGTSVGATLKILSQGLTGADEGSATGINIDLGAVSQVTPYARAGVTLVNVIPGSLSWQSGASEDMPMSLNVGGSFNIMGPGENSINKSEHIVVGVLDARYGFAAEDGLTLHGGLEWEPIKYLNVRCGLDQMWVSNDEGTAGTAINLTAGVGFNYEGIIFDYAYYQDSNLQANQSHYFSISYSPLPVTEKKVKKVKEVKEVKEVKKDPGYYYDENGVLIIEGQDKGDFDFEKELEVSIEKDKEFNMEDFEKEESLKLVVIED
jgi:hypothetical protein